jgi:cation diffusion facilitator CzcD-associated flavoprotein CzcO
MAAKLQDAGIETFTIFEKADEVGGTWRDNTYPGLSCDVPSRFYAYSFRPNPAWSRLMSPGPEIHSYFRQVATERGIRPHIRFGSDVTSARYRDGQWWVGTADGEEAFDVLITATGFFGSRDTRTSPGSTASPARCFTRRGGTTPLRCPTNASD